MGRLEDELGEEDLVSAFVDLGSCQHLGLKQLADSACIPGIYTSSGIFRRSRGLMAVFLDCASFYSTFTKLRDTFSKRLKITFLAAIGCASIPFILFGES